MSHENLSVELGLLHEVGQACTVVNMKVCYEEKFDLLGVDAIEVRELIYVFTSRM